MSLLLNLTNNNFLIFLTKNPPILNPYLPQKSENLRPHSSNSIENVTPLLSLQSWKCDPIQGHIPNSLLYDSPPPPGELASSKSGVRSIIREMGLIKASKWGKGGGGGVSWGKSKLLLKETNSE